MVCKAVVIGINYMYSGIQLNGCIRDAKNIAIWLEVHRGFKRENIHLLTDDNPMGSPDRPNKTNILNAIDWLLCDMDEDDVCFLTFSGHGSCVYDYNEHSINDKTNIIYVLKRNIIEIFDYELRKKLVSSPAKIICILDCCQSGSIFDLKYKLDTTFTAKHDIEDSVGNLIVISSCGDEEFASDSNEGGFLTITFLKLIMANPQLNLVELNNGLNEMAKGHPQHPVIHCGKQICLTEPLTGDPIPTNQTYRYSLPNIKRSL